ncbi:hypothetical protein ED208_15325 [Stagnimonas aquatica]|uniref:DUF4852 domain-containing protein n=1 Tax=Stagnimonas aquatica TaxID=2689987 RepID=A0A3N0V1P4_9GAMM|nr:hypothetical protein [Stagnimonas aquatica]ROH86408.1 hypothetical protein ED208_15325 [Stagnimonas aquatica]
MLTLATRFKSIDAPKSRSFARETTILVSLVTAFMAGCATGPDSAREPRYKAPWAQYQKVAFKDLLTSYGVSNLSVQRQETLDMYLRSQTKTFDRYVAAKEVGVGMEPLQQEAIAEIETAGAELSSKLFVIRTLITANAYDARLGGFPLYQLPMDTDASLRFSNDDVRTSKSREGVTRGMSFAAEGYGLVTAELWFSKVGWVLPAAPERAVQILERLSKVDGERKVAVAMVFSLDRCDLDRQQRTMLACRAKIVGMSAYSGLDAMQPSNPPLLELEYRGRR